MRTASAIKMNARQYLQLGEDPPGIRLELAHGEIYLSPSPTPDHRYVIHHLALILGNHVKAGRLGEVYMDIDTILDDYNVRRPDLLFFDKDRLSLIGKKAMEGPPDLAVEVISPSSFEIDREDKFREYEKAGVRHYWIVDPEQRTLEMFELRGGREAAGAWRDRETAQSSLFPGLAIPLGELWRP